MQSDIFSKIKSSITQWYIKNYSMKALTELLINVPTPMPNNRPQAAPISRHGMNKPLGTDKPYVQQAIMK